MLISIKRSYLFSGHQPLKAKSTNDKDIGKGKETKSSYSNEIMLSET